MPKYFKNNKKKEVVLGMSLGKAIHRLRKMVLFNLAGRLGLLTCFRCNKQIESINEFTIEHKIAWLDKGADYFWDLNNIAFSHSLCNSRAAIRPKHINYNHAAVLKTRKIGPEGTAWCSKCQQFLAKELFSKCRTRWSGCNSYCKECAKPNMKIQNRKRLDKMKALA